MFEQLIKGNITFDGSSLEGVALMEELEAAVERVVAFLLVLPEEALMVDLLVEVAFTFLHLCQDPQVQLEHP